MKAAPNRAVPAWFDLRGRWRAWWAARLQPRERQTLAQRNIYIVPTRAGLLFAATLLLLLIASINFQLSLGFALTFLLAGSAAASMHMTHGCLRGLTLHLKPLQACFAGEAALLEVVVTNPGAARAGIGFGLDAAAAEGLSFADIRAQEQTVVHLAWQPPGRGRHALPVLRAETRYPFGLFRAWTLWRPAGHQWAYPRPESPTPPWPGADAVHGDENARPLPGRGIEFDGVRAYRRGDPLRQIVWKKAARTGDLVSRESTGEQQRELWLSWSQAGPGDDEARLSRLAAWVLGADSAGHLYGLRLPGFELPPAAGPGHRQAALQALAAW